MNFLYRDGLNLLYWGKELLARNFYFNLINFLRKDIPSKHTPELKGSSLNKENKEWSDIECFRNLRKKHFKKPLMEYLSINNLISKTTDLRETL